MTAILKPNGEQTWPRPASASQAPPPPHSVRPRGRRVALLCRADDAASRRLLERLERILRDSAFCGDLCFRSDDAQLGLVVVPASQELPFFQHQFPTIVIDDRPPLLTSAQTTPPAIPDRPNRVLLASERLETDLVALIERLLDP